MVRLYKCFTGDNTEDWCVEIQGSHAGYPDRLIYFSDFGGSFEDWQRFCIDETLDKKNSDELKNLFLTLKRQYAIIEPQKGDRQYEKTV